MFSSGGCEDPQCGAWNGCYFVYGQKLDGECHWYDGDVNKCQEPPPGGWKVCNDDISIWCCDEIDDNCEVELIWYHEDWILVNHRYLSKN